MKCGGRCVIDLKSVRDGMWRIVCDGPIEGT